MAEWMNFAVQEFAGRHRKAWLPGVRTRFVDHDRGPGSGCRYRWRRAREVSRSQASRSIVVLEPPAPAPSVSPGAHSLMAAHVACCASAQRPEVWQHSHRAIFRRLMRAFLTSFSRASDRAAKGRPRSPLVVSRTTGINRPGAAAALDRDSIFAPQKLNPAGPTSQMSGQRGDRS